MKRLTLILGAAAALALSTPQSAHAQIGCSWWDLSCNGLASRIVDYGWHTTGRDQYGNVVYMRRLVDSNGNVIFEQAHRNDLGRYLVTNTHTIRKGTVYGPNGEICKYSSNDKGYKEDCKYAKVNYGAKPKTVKYEAPKYKAPKYKPVKYEPPKAIHYDNDVKGPKPHAVDYHAAKPHDEKTHDEKGKGKH